MAFDPDLYYLRRGYTERIPVGDFMDLDDGITRVSERRQPSICSARHPRWAW